MSRRVQRLLTLNPPLSATGRRPSVLSVERRLLRAGKDGAEQAEIEGAKARGGVSRFCLHLVNSPHKSRIPRQCATSVWKAFPLRSRERRGCGRARAMAVELHRAGWLAALDGGRLISATGRQDHDEPGGGSRLCGGHPLPWDVAYRQAAGEPWIGRRQGVAAYTIDDGARDGRGGGAEGGGDCASHAWRALRRSRMSYLRSIAPHADLPIQSDRETP